MYILLIASGFRSHEGIRPYVCRSPGCSRAFTLGTVRKRHEKRDHDLDINMKRGSKSKYEVHNVNNAIANAIFEEAKEDDAVAEDQQLHELISSGHPLPPPPVSQHQEQTTVILQNHDLLQQPPVASQQLPQQLHPHQQQHQQHHIQQLHPLQPHHFMAAGHPHAGVFSNMVLNTLHQSELRYND